jgi:adenylate cyclase class IV
MRNVEIKAVLRNPAGLHAVAAALAGTEPTVILQRDTFFKSPTGRLKLRTEKVRALHISRLLSRKAAGPPFLVLSVTLHNAQVDGITRSSLIFYNRPDTLDAKLSEYDIAAVVEPDSLRSVLAKAHGVRGEVVKTRKLFLVGQTRVHVDSVEGLGDYVELEVVLDDQQSVEDGQAVARDLMQKLGIDKGDLLTGAYMDMIVS